MIARRLLAVGSVALMLLIGPALPAEDSGDAEIDYLLSFVASSGCQFQRNGDLHDPESAADHLRLKYSRGKRYVESAEHFIDRLASESSWTGEPYTVICGGVEEPTAAWLHRALASHRNAGG